MSYSTTLIAASHRALDSAKGAKGQRTKKAAAGELRKEAAAFPQLWRSFLPLNYIKLEFYIIEGLKKDNNIKRPNTALHVVAPLCRILIIFKYRKQQLHASKLGRFYSPYHITTFHFYNNKRHGEIGSINTLIVFNNYIYIST